MYTSEWVLKLILNVQSLYVSHIFIKTKDFIAKFITYFQYLSFILILTLPADELYLLQTKIEYLLKFAKKRTQEQSVRFRFILSLSLLTKSLKLTTYNKRVIKLFMALIQWVVDYFISPKCFLKVTSSKTLIRNPENCTEIYL